MDAVSGDPVHPFRSRTLPGSPFWVRSEMQHGGEVSVRAEGASCPCPPEAGRNDIWRPGELSEKLVAWYREHGRDFPWRRAEGCYERVIAELLLQRTQAATIAKFYPQFLSTFPSWQALAAASEVQLQEFLKPIGLWRRRARGLVELARAVSKMGGELPKSREEIDRLPGVGQYIRNAILLLCYGQAEPLLDVNMARVLERIFGPRTRVDIRDDPRLQALARAVVACNHPKEVNWAILDLAATLCLPRKARCWECPLACGCLFARCSLERCKGTPTCWASSVLGSSDDGGVPVAASRGRRRSGRSCK